MFSYKYARPALAVDAVVFGANKSSLDVLLIQRAGEPFRGQWALPGGFVNVGENTDAAVKRELREETGIKTSRLEQLRTFSAGKRDPREHVVSVAHLALVRPDQHKPKAASDAKAVRWFPMSALPKLAFDHSEIIAVALDRLRSKVRYAPLGFDLLNQEFTLAELQTLYENILGRKLDKRNFRKKMVESGLLTPTALTPNTRPPSMLYTFNAVEYERLTKAGTNFVF